MKKPILFIQFRTDESEKHEQDCVLEKGNFKKSDLHIVNVLRNGTKLPKPEDLDKYQAVITGASGQFNTTDWSDGIRKKCEKFLPLLQEIIKRDFPMLSICFGHHVIANLLEGKVENDDDQAEAGTYKVYLTEKGKKSELFKGIPDDFYVVLGHKDSITKLPKQAQRLAYSNRCKVAAYQIKNHIYSVQFHPEIDLDALIWRLKLYPDYLKGRTLDDVRNDYSEIPYATKIIANFKEIVEQNGIH